jgi:hypothetical protein
MIAILACAASLAVAAALTPTASAAPPARSCGSKEIAVREAGKTLTVPVSRITVSGAVTCKQAYTVIGAVLRKDIPKGWKVTTGAFNVPRGLVARQAVDGSKKIWFATVGP